MRRLSTTFPAILAALWGCKDTSSSSDEAGDAADTNGDSPGPDDSGDDDDTGADGDTGGPGPGSANCPDPGAADPADGLLHLGRGQYGQSGGFLEILDVVADGTVVYQCTATQGLMTFDAQGDGGPLLGAERIGGPFAHPQFPRCQHIGADFENDRLVITSRGDEVQPDPFLYMFDISNPGAPQPLVGWQGPASIEGVVLVGSTVYAAAHDQGIVVFEDQGGTDLVDVGGFMDADSDAWQPFLAGDTLFVAEGATGLRLYDVSAGGIPTLLSTVPLQGSSKDVIVQDDVAFVAASSFLAAVDITDPSNPTVLAEREVLGTALAVAMGQNNNLLVAEWDELRGYDASDPSSLTHVLSETVPTEANFSRVLTVDAVPAEAGGMGRVYAGEWEGLHAFDQPDCAYGPEIWISPSALTFGVIPPGNTEARVVVVRNNGNLPLRISTVDSPDVQLTADTQDFEVAPGTAKSLEVALAPSSDVQFNGILTLASNDIDEPELHLRVAGNVAGLGVGDPAPSYNLFDLDGAAHSDADLLGQVTVLAYFATF